MDERFLRAWFCRPRRVLGRWLQPFSLAHRLVLEAIDSPFCYTSRPFTFPDLAIAVRICAATNPFDPLPPPTWREKCAFWRARFDPGYFRRCSQQFVDYLDDCCASPKFWEKADPESITRESLPWALNVAACLLRQTSLSEEEVWRMPLGRALWYATALAKQEGSDIEVLSTEEEEELEALRLETLA